MCVTVVRVLKSSDPDHKEDDRVLEERVGKHGLSAAIRRFKLSSGRYLRTAGEAALRCSSLFNKHARDLRASIIIPASRHRPILFGCNLLIPLLQLFPVRSLRYLVKMLFLIFYLSTSRRSVVLGEDFTDTGEKLVNNRNTPLLTYVYTPSMRSCRVVLCRNACCG